jgi:hypothetical protein
MVLDITIVFMYEVIYKNYNHPNKTNISANTAVINRQLTTYQVDDMFRLHVLSYYPACT